MVDPHITKNQSNREAKLKSFMGKTPALLKSKLLSVLDSSNEILNGISNRVRIMLLDLCFFIDCNIRHVMIISSYCIYYLSSL